jgi:hypothetical protein
MLPLRYAGRWRIAGYLLLAMVLAAAMVPPAWFGLSNSLSYIANFDKWLHGITFTALMLWFSGQYARHGYWRPGTGLVAFGLLIEIAQRTVSYRTADGMDLMADLAGISLGAALALAGLGGWCKRFEDGLQNRNG